ncbi:MAG: hypothetical protein V9G19_04405 [Tetrasphaera sp.]
MSSYDPRSLLDKVLAACVTLLLAALVLHWAVGLIEEDWPWLVGIAIAVLVTASLTMWLRSRQGGW